MTIRPTVVSIDNSEATALASTKTKSSDSAQILRPIKTLLKLTGDRGAEYTQDLLGDMTRASVDVYEFVMTQHPGRRLPLGWTLSDGSLKDVQGQFQLCDSQKAAAKVNDALGTGPTTADGCV